MKTLTQQSASGLKIRLLLFLTGIILSFGNVAQAKFRWHITPTTVCPDQNYLYNWSGRGTFEVFVIDPNGDTTNYNTVDRNFYMDFPLEGIYKVYGRFVPYYLNFFTSNFGSKFHFSVQSRYPYPNRHKEEFVWCGPNETQTIHITGINNTAEDCFYPTNGTYSYIAPAGWTFVQNGQSTISTSLRSLDLTTPANVTPGAHQILVTRDIAPSRTSILPAWVGVPNMPTGPIVEHVLRSPPTFTVNTICKGDEITFSYPTAEEGKQYVWQVSGSNSYQIVNNYVRVNCDTEGPLIIQIAESNRCGTSPYKTISFQVIECFDQNGGGDPILGGNSFGLTAKVFTGLSPFAEDPTPLSLRSWKRYIPKINTGIPGDEVHGSFDIEFHDEQNTESNPYTPREHDMGMTYEVTLTDLSTGIIDYQTTDTKMIHEVSTENLNISQYEVQLRNANSLLIDTLDVKSTCNGDCFKGISPSTGGIVDLTPVFMPNPIIGQSTLDLHFFEDLSTPTFPNHDIGFTYTIQVVDLQGNTFMNVPGLSMQQVNLPTNNLPPGTYVAIVSSPTATYSTVIIRN